MKTSPASGRPPRARPRQRGDWTQIDRVHFAECIIARAKTCTPQAPAIPGALAPFLRAWWERAGKPESGPCFPCAKAPAPARSERRAEALPSACVASCSAPGSFACLPSKRPQTNRERAPTSASMPRHPARAEPTRPLLLRDGNHASGGLPLAPAREHGPRAGRRQRAACDPPRFARHHQDAHAVRNADDRDANDPDAALPILPPSPIESSRPDRGDARRDSIRTPHPEALAAPGGIRSERTTPQAWCEKT
jgi:hypothetical protein